MTKILAAVLKLVAKRRVFRLWSFSAGNKTTNATCCKMQSPRDALSTHPLSSTGDGTARG